MRQEKNNSSNIFLRRPLSVSSPPQWATANLCVSRRPCSSTCLVCGLLGALWSQLRLWPVSNPSWTCPQSPLLLKARLVSVVEALTVYSDIPLVQDLSNRFCAGGQRDFHSLTLAIPPLELSFGFAPHIPVCHPQAPVLCPGEKEAKAAAD